MPTVCIFTPTYNRAHTLPRLYQSLVGQTCEDFLWMVVDDGSEDGTEELVNSWKREGAIQVCYFRVVNGGKPRAVNLGVSRCECPLFYVVDSDDYLVPTAIEHIVGLSSDLYADKSLAGIVALNGSDELTPLGTWMPEALSRVKCWDLSERYRFQGDASLIYKTDVLKQHPFEVAAGEKFVAETSVYYRLDDEYDLHVDNTVLKICCYLEDGLTKNFVANAKANPIGYWKHKKYCAARSRTLVSKMRETTLYLVGCMLAGEKGAVRRAPNPLIALVCTPLAFALRYMVFR
ncbi:MAG: glycosyltransferase family 2 protein [Coriobacteriaceae bacterium]|nr:glycosyltransferase family 2 protein [Coriobacteriaceae bacterium]